MRDAVSALTAFVENSVSHAAVDSDADGAEMRDEKKSDQAVGADTIENASMD